MIRWVCWFWEDDQRDKAPCSSQHISSHHIKSTDKQHEYHCWCKTPSPGTDRVLQVSPLLPSSHAVLLGRKSPCTSPPEAGEACSTSWRAGHMTLPWLADLPLRIVFFWCYFHEIFLYIFISNYLLLVFSDTVDLMYWFYKLADFAYLFQ